MKGVFYILAIFSSTIVYAQEFSFKMYFKDFVGHTDSIELGYDITASDSIDPQFGETNILNTPFDSVFEVRISNEFRLHQNFQVPNYDSSKVIHLKKQINGSKCMQWNNEIPIDIYAKYWPVTAYWKSSAFQDSCRDGTFFTDYLQWFDVGGTFLSSLINQDSVVLETNNMKDLVGPPPNYYWAGYIRPNGDTVFTPLFVFISWEALIDNIDNQNGKKQSLLNQNYPNPFIQTTNIETNITSKSAVLEIYNSLEEIVHHETLKPGNNLTTFKTTSPGFYYYSLIVNGQRTETKKMIALE